MKNTFRFFVPPAALSTDGVHLADPTLAHQLGRVLRLGPGDHVLLLDGSGSACRVELTALTRDAVAGRVVERKAAGGELPASLIVFLPLIRPERFEWAMQKCVELGAARIVPVAFARSLPADRADARRLERWRRITREAAEQSCRGLLPAVDEPIDLPTACAQAAATDLALLLWEGEAPRVTPLLRERGATLGRPLSALALLSGPEGGITGAELTAAQAHGIIPVSLGPRILRAETAPVAAAAILAEALTP